MQPIVASRDRSKQAAMLVLLLRGHCVLWGESRVKGLPPFSPMPSSSCVREIKFRTSSCLTELGERQTKVAFFGDLQEQRSPHLSSYKTLTLTVGRQEARLYAVGERKVTLTLNTSEGR